MKYQLTSNAYLVLFCLLTGCAQNSVSLKRSQPENSVTSAPMRIIDAHTHFHVRDFGPNQPSVKMMSAFKEAGIVGAVIHLGSDEEGVVQFSRENAPFKVALCAAIVPGVKLKKIEAGLKINRYQCMKVYLGYIPKYATDPFYRPFYQLAQKYDVPVVFHTGDTYDRMAKVKYADPLPIDEIAVEYPKVNFVIAHMGNPWFASAAEVVYKNKNVSVDLSALMLGDLSKENEEKIDTLVVKPLRWFYWYVENPKKLLFGTDWPLLEIKPYIEAVKRAIPKEDWEDVFYNNAAALFKIK